MRTLSTAELVDTWEQGLAQQPVERALALLAAAWPELSPDQLAGWSIGERDAQLLALREWTFGPHLSSVATCPTCGEQLELEFETGDIRFTPPEGSEDLLRLSSDGYDVRLRLPNSLDVAVSTRQARHGDVAAGRRLLLERCVAEARHEAKAVKVADLPASLVEQAIARLAEADPQGDVQLSLCCPTCGCAWQATFDIVSFFWNEVGAWAYRTLQEVHVLASAHGWHEAEILALSPWRRRFYLETVTP